jgi:hypothetical protein
VILFVINVNKSESRKLSVSAANAAATPLNTQEARYRAPSTRLASAVLSGSSAMKMIGATVAIRARFTEEGSYQRRSPDRKHAAL